MLAQKTGRKSHWYILKGRLKLERLLQYLRKGTRDRRRGVSFFLPPVPRAHVLVVMLETRREEPLEMLPVEGA